MENLAYSIIALTVAVAGLIIILVRPHFEKKAADEEALASDTQTKSDSMKLTLQLAQQTIIIQNRLYDVETALRSKLENEKKYIEQIMSLNEALSAAQMSIIQHRKEIDQLRAELANCIDVQSKQKNAS